MGETPLEAVIAKVQKLLRLAQSDNPNEAANAAKAADKLIQEHGLVDAQLETSGEKPAEEIGECPDNVALWHGRVPTWELTLCFGLIRHYGCAGYRTWTYPGGRPAQAARVVGRPSDVAAFRAMWTWLRHEIERLALLNRGEGRSWLDSFRKGAVRGVLDKLYDGKKAVEQAEEAKQEVARAILGSAPASTALALYKGRGDAAKEKLHELHEDLAKRAKRSRGGVTLPGASVRDAYHTGKEVGRNIHTGASLGSGGGAPKALKGG